MIEVMPLLPSSRRYLPGALGILGATLTGIPTEGKLVTYLNKPNALGQVAIKRTIMSEIVLGVMLYRCDKAAIKLDCLAVCNGWRRRGVGRLLLSRLTHRLKGACRFTVEARAADALLPQAHRFLLGCGFRQGWHKDGVTRFFFPYATFYNVPDSETVGAGPIKL